MSGATSKVRRGLWLATAIEAASTCHAAGRLSAGMRPSDCRPRDADSTCATAVAGATGAAPPTGRRETTLYDGPLGGVPAAGYAYWGWDFTADQTGIPSPVRPDMFINRSSVPVTITLSFNFPTNHPCADDCLPGVQFQVDAGWFKLDPPFQINGNIASVSETFVPGRGYGWVIGLWQATNTRLTVSVPLGSTATLDEVGLSASPAVAQPIPATTSLCDCSDGTQALCSDGSRYSNGLLGRWTRTNEFYERSGAFNSCAAQR
jgi:hypothetical protein